MPSRRHVLVAFTIALLAGGALLPLPRSDPATPLESTATGLASPVPDLFGEGVAATTETVDEIGLPLQPSDDDQALLEGYLAGVQVTLDWAQADSTREQAQGRITATLSPPSIDDLRCPEELDAEECRWLGEEIGQAMGLVPFELVAPFEELLPEAELPPLPSDAEQQAIVDSVLAGSLPELAECEPERAGSVLFGIVRGLFPEALASDDHAEVSAAIATAMASVRCHLPASLLAPVAEEMAKGLEGKDPATMGAMARASVHRANETARASQNDALLVVREVGAFLKGDAVSNAVVTVTDGARTLSGGGLKGTSSLDGLHELTFELVPSASTIDLPQEWRLVWAIGDGAEQVKDMTRAADGSWRASLAPSAIAAAPRGASIDFRFVQAVAGSTEVGDGSKTYSFRPDRDVPVVTLSAPATASGASFDVSWAGADGDSGIDSFRVEKKDGNGAWAVWIDDAQETTATFSGVAGHTYAFRVIARDAVGHLSIASAETAVAIPAGVPPNRAPSVLVRAPASGAIFGAAIPVELSASDPDGTAPVVRVCLRKADSGVDLVCLAEGKTLILQLDAMRVPDGRYKLHVIATDGTQSAEAFSGVFSLDRAPPAFRAASVEATPSLTTLEAAVDPDATRVLADVSGLRLTLLDDGKGADEVAGDGTWTAQAPLPAGEHQVLYRASDANGNEADLQRTVVVPAAPGAVGAPAGEAPAAANEIAAPSSEVAPGAPVEAEPAKGTPAAPLGALLVALAALAGVRRRR